MNSTNYIILSGQVSDLPKIRYFSYDNAILTLTLETCELGLRHDGSDWKQWHKLMFNNALASEVENRVKKGDYLKVQGRLVYHKEYDKEGRATLQTLIYVNDFELLKECPECRLEDEDKIAEMYQNISYSWDSFGEAEEEDPMA